MGHRAGEEQARRERGVANADISPDDSMHLQNPWGHYSEFVQVCVAPEYLLYTSVQMPVWELPFWPAQQGLNQEPTELKTCIVTI